MPDRRSDDEEGFLVCPCLVASDNKRCGGVNVTSDGVYRKKE